MIIRILPEMHELGDFNIKYDTTATRHANTFKTNVSAPNIRFSYNHNSLLPSELEIIDKVKEQLKDNGENV